MNHCSESTQENFGNDSDMVNAMLLTLIDRCGDDDNLAYKMYEYIKSFPSKLNLDLDLDNAFSHLFKRRSYEIAENILKSIEGLSDIELFVIDLFCGAGGLSEGVEEARLDGNRCGKVVCCVNHDKNAILSHDANIPDALHFIEDIRTLELSPISTIVERIRQLYPDAMIMLHASLECTNFSKAKGGQPRDADSRTLAEHLFRYIDVIDPDYIQIEM